MKPLTGSGLVSILLLALSVPAMAADVRVSARLRRPIWRNDSGARDRYMQSNLGWVAASYQMVRVYQPRKLGDAVIGKIYCGTVFTDSNGEFSEDFICGDGNLPDQLYLEVWAESSRGFSVGAFDRVKFDTEMFALGGAAALGALFVSVGTFGAGAIAAVATAAGVGSDVVLNLLDKPPASYVWVTPTRSATRGAVSFGTFRLGRGRTGRAATSDDYAAAVMEGVDYAHAEMVGNAPRSPDWAWSFWIIDNPYFGAPTTIWDKVHINPGVINDPSSTLAQNLDDSWKQNMRSLVHELGHVIYNHGHSDKAHYFDPNEALYYARNHENCRTRVSAKFAQYEGFAEAVSQVIWRDPVYDVAVAATCPTRLGAAYPPYIGFETEGNVADFYASMIHGFDNQRGSTTLHGYTTVKQGANAVVLPPLEALLNMPRSAGSSSHSLFDMWRTYWRALCEQLPTASSPLSCGTERFRCWVAQTSRLAPASELPDAFRGLDCRPGAVSNVSVTTITATTSSSKNDVKFSGGDHVESYSITIRQPPAGTVRAMRTPDLPSATGISLVPCQPHSVAVSAVNTFGVIAGSPLVFTPGTQAVCGPVGPAVQSVTHSHDEADLMEARLEAFEILRPAEDDSENRAPGTGPERLPEKERTITVPPAAVAERTVEDRITELFSDSKRCYRVELAMALRTTRYAVRYRLDDGGTEGASAETLSAPDRVLIACMEGGRRYVLNGVGYNDYGSTVGPDYEFRVPPRLEISRVKGRVITRFPRP